MRYGNQIKTGSINQRLTSEENTNSSPSAGKRLVNNMSHSIGNKSVHYGLSS